MSGFRNIIFHLVCCFCYCCGSFIACHLLLVGYGSIFSTVAFVFRDDDIGDIYLNLPDSSYFYLMTLFSLALNDVLVWCLSLTVKLGLYTDTMVHCLSFYCIIKLQKEHKVRI